MQRSAKLSAGNEEEDDTDEHALISNYCRRLLENEAMSEGEDEDVLLSDGDCDLATSTPNSPVATLKREKLRKQIEVLEEENRRLNQEREGPYITFAPCKHCASRKSPYF